MYNEPGSSFSGLSLHPIDALKNISILIEAGCLLSSSSNIRLIEIGDAITWLSRDYAVATQQQPSTSLPVESPTSFESIPAFLRTQKPYPEPQSAGGEGIAQRYYIAAEVDEYDNETGRWTIHRQDQDGITDTIMIFNSQTSAEEALAELKADEQQPISTGALAIDEPLPNWGATIKVAKQQLAWASAKRIGDRIRLRREMAGMSQEDLAIHIGMAGDVASLAEWEKNLSEPCATEIVRLANTLNCDYSRLLIGDAEANIQPVTNEAPLAPVEVMQGVDMSGVGERIRDARVSRRMTHKELEEAAGLPDGVISLWEFRQAYPPDEAFDKLAKALNTSVIWLLTGREIARES